MQIEGAVVPPSPFVPEITLMGEVVQGGSEYRRGRLLVRGASFIHIYV